MPFVPQVDEPWAAHRPAGSGAPVGTSVQVPMAVGSAHVRQFPVHAVAQQMPCAQKPDAHSPALEQKAPTSFLPHELVASHVLGIWQSALVRQDAKQRAPLHAKGAHGSDWGVTHCPPLSQVEGPV
jgi:hypothetical protein